MTGTSGVRFRGEGNCFSEIQRPLINCPPGDDAHDSLVLDRQELLYIVQTIEATAGNDRNGEFLGQFDGGVDIDARQHAALPLTPG